MPKGHLGPIKMEEVHQFDYSTLAKRSEVDALGFVIQLKLDRKDLNVLCNQSARQQREQLDLRKNGSLAAVFLMLVGDMGAVDGVGTEKLKNRLRKSSAS